MLNFRARFFIFACLLLAAVSASANRASALYDVEVLVVDESADTRWRVFKNGMDEVFIRLSGDRFVMDKLKRPPASRYIKQYSYDPVQNPLVNDDDEILAHRLKIQYNGSTMAKYLRDNGFPVWGEHRPDVVIWLAIRDGRNEYVLKDNDQSLLKTAADAALHRRGIPDRWPLYDYKDRKILKVADIRGGFRDPLLNASKRYSRGPALAGSLIWNGEVWQSSWSLLMANANKHWSLIDADYNALIDKAIDQAADAMGATFATHGIGKDQQQAVVRLQIEAVNSIQKYRKLENYLGELTAVAQITSLQVGAQSASFDITLRSSEDEFFSLIRNDAELIEVAPAQAQVKPQPLLETTPQVPSGLPSGSEAKPLEKSTAEALPELKTGATDEEQAVLQAGPQEKSQSESKLQQPQVLLYHYKLNQ